MRNGLYSKGSGHAIPIWYFSIHCGGPYREHSCNPSLHILPIPPILHDAIALNCYPVSNPHLPPSILVPRHQTPTSPRISSKPIRTHYRFQSTTEPPPSLPPTYSLSQDFATHPPPTTVPHPSRPSISRIITSYRSRPSQAGSIPLL